MALWADKYRPTDLSSLDYHKQQAEHLINLTKDRDFPHLLVHGPMGAGKSTRIMCLLRELYGSGVDRVKVETNEFTTPSNKKLEITTASSNYHIELQPSDAGIHDHVVIMQVIKSVAKTQQVNANGQRDFKVVLLTGIDELTKNAQHALRRTMEKYVSQCRIIMSSNSISRIIPAIQSRCISIRVPAPTHEDIVKILKSTCTKEQLTISDSFARRIAEESDRNLRRALLMCEACKVQAYPFTDDQAIAQPDWLVFIKSIVQKMFSKPSRKMLLKVREDLYELIQSGIPSEIIMKVMLEEILKFPDMRTRKVVECAANYGHRLLKGNKEIFHLEAFVTQIVSWFREMVSENLFAKDWDDAFD